MNPWPLLLVAVLTTSPAPAAEKKKDEKKSAQAAPVAAPPDVVKQAEDKVAAGDVTGAVALLQKAAPTDGRAGLRLGVLLEGRGELDLAIDAYQAATEKLTGPAKGEALGRLAVVQEARGIGDADAKAEAAVAADAEGLWPTIALAYRRAHGGQADEAVALARKAEAAGGGAAAKGALGYALAARGDLAGAEAAYREATSSAAVDLMSRVGLAVVLRRTNRAAEAEPLLQKVIDGAGGVTEAYKEMARVQLALGRVREALSNANLAAAMAENDADAQKLVMQVKVARSLRDVNEGQAALAIEDLTALRDRNPDSAIVRVGLGRAQIARRDAASALAELQKAVELDPKDAEAQHQLGYVQHVMKQNAAAALGPLERAAELDPANPAYRISLGAALVDAGQLDRAVAELSKLTAGADPGPDAWFYLGAAHFKAQRFKDAAAALEKSLAAKPANAQAEAFLAWSYVGLKDAANFKVHGAKARALGWKDPELMARLSKIEAGESFKDDKPGKARSGKAGTAKPAKTARPRTQRVP